MAPTAGPAPAIFFLSDYGTADGFVGVVHAVLHRRAPDTTVIDLSHGVPPFDVAAGASLLARWVADLGPGVVLAVVDPGVGTARRGIAVQVSMDPGHPTWLVGPDNGLLVPAAAALGGVVAAWVLEGADLEGRGRTFDGRDVFAPAAAHLVTGGDPSLVAAPLHPDTLVDEVRPSAPAADRIVPTPSGPQVATSVSSIDRFGNVELTGSPALLGEMGLRPGEIAQIVPHWSPPAAPGSEGITAAKPTTTARWVATFGELEPGELGLLIDSAGRLALVLDRASAAELLGLERAGLGVGIGTLAP